MPAQLNLQARPATDMTAIASGEELSGGALLADFTLEGQIKLV